MRLTISTRHHWELLNRLAAQMEMGTPTDALEHILSCWIACGGNFSVLSVNPPKPFKPSDPVDLGDLLD